MTQPTAATSSTYTTIPISSTTDIVSRSVHNFTTFISTHRPWPELITSGLFSRPDSFSAALTRLNLNFRYFLINYAIIITLCAALSLIGTPIALILFAVIFGLWLIIYYFREDPLVLLGHQVSDHMIFAGLAGFSILGFWLSGAFWSLVLGICVGVLACGIHASLRNNDEEQDDSRNLIGSRSGYGSKYGTISGI
ncbi:PRA1 family protein G2 [Mercurialis annua]|uniref:PRA1 family protein G2 n=1 Tax=Mercurialis annua TaxID=3986 RepID=UPI002160982D|nr:PRA1 family protein G2 [Mercurialis annua]